MFGLRENASDRSNLALVNMNSAVPVTLRVTLISGTDGKTSVLPDITLAGGQWTQIGHVLSGPGFVNGFAIVELISGPGPFYPYGVFNDNTTADGSFVPPTIDGDARSILPVLVETSTFQSELVLTNPHGQASVATMTYVESLSPAGGAGGVAMETLGPNEQKIIPGAIDYLRGKGVSIGARGAAGYAGAVQTTFHNAGGSFNVRIRRGQDFRARARRRPVRRLLPGAPDRRERPHRGMGLRAAAERDEPLEPRRRELRQRRADHVPPRRL